MKKLFYTVSMILFTTALFAQVKTTYYANGQKMSEGVLLNADATVLADNFSTLPKDVQATKMQNCAKDGKWVSYWMDGKVSNEQYYANGKFVGVWKSFSQDGQVTDVIDFNQGKASYFHKNGKLQSEGKMRNDMRQDGPWTIFYENGSKNAEGTYINGIKDGVWVWYDISGKKTNEQVFKNGTIVSNNKF